MNSTAWDTFKERAATEPGLVEGVIKAVYHELLSEGDECVDGGAHMGFHTLPLSRIVGPSGCVVAIEANRRVYEKFSRKVARKKLGNVKLEFAALQDDPKRESVNFYCSKEFPARSGISRPWDLISPGTVDYEDADDVPATTIDKLAEQHSLSKIGFIKLDLEGGEFPALKGGAKTLEAARPVIVAEHSEKAAEISGFAVGDYFGFLERVGYRAMAPNGVAITTEDPFPFWYVFLVPEERVDFLECLTAYQMRKALEGREGETHPESARLEIEAVREVATRQEGDLETAQAKLKDARSQLEACQDKNAKRDGKIGSLERELQNTRRKLDESRQEVARIKQSWQYRPLEKLLKPWKYRR